MLNIIYRNAGTSLGQKKLRAMETYEKRKKIVTNASYCSTTMLIPKIIKETIEKCVLMRS